MNEVSLALVGGTLIDGTEKGPIEEAAVIIEGSRIKDVGKENEVQIPKSAKIINLNGKTLIPGLIDCHVHLMGLSEPSFLIGLIEPKPLKAIRAAKDAWKALNAGFTTLRDAGSSVAISVKRAIEEGTINGPRIMAAGFAISQTGGHGDHHYLPISWLKEPREFSILADGVEECIKAVRKQLRDGADVIKVIVSGRLISKHKPIGFQFSMPAIPAYTPEEIKAIVKEAHKMKKKVMAHALEPEGIKNAIESGVDTIEHGVYLNDEVCEMMRKKEVIYVPTLCLYHRILEERFDENVRANYEMHLKSFKKAIEFGVKIAVGTDTFFSKDFGRNSQELELMVKAGMSPLDVVISATKISAKALGIDKELGTIEPGKIADLLVVNGNPLKDIKVLRNLENIEFIFKDGKMFKAFRSSLSNLFNVF